ncbi:zinc finger BED domain-containing protein RICESLEEPER 2-like [Papaver somniferum]|uniref:zinc finger BED domain-containing protein RICESLEEPER 2-like n=1 Tax=Papaver somniferum TaxID=3469 RepID=UPI000E6FCD8D|nr:zinc finger BED domain-containing protein RICESLEEPER 2-like [Papaver somniferum]
MEYKKGLVLDVKTRWNSIYLMLDAAEKYEKVFIRLGRSDKSFRERFIFDIPDEPVMGDNVDDIDSTDIPDKLESSSSDSDAPEEPLSGRRKAKKKKPRVHAPEKYDWANARVLVQFLQVFFEATVEIYGSTYVTSHTFLEEICDVRGELNEWKKAHYDPHLSHMGEKMFLKYDKYWGEYKNMNPLFFIAVLLDPREKERGLQVILEDLIMHDIPWMKQRLVKNWLDKVKEDFNELFTAYKAEYAVVGSVLASSESVGEIGGSPSQAISSSSSTLHRKRRYKDHREERKTQLSTMEDFDKSEVERYLSEQIYSPTKDKKEGSKFDILTWWKSNAARFDILSLIARDILVIPVSSVASESAFSTGKRILGHFRSSLRPELWKH